MNLLPMASGGSGLIAWRLDQSNYAATWDSGEGAYRVGGRWNSKGVRAVYCSIDLAMAILEVAVHKGFRARYETASPIRTLDNSARRAA
jgi:RES domain-containing protein